MNHNFEILAVSLDDNRADAEAFAQSAKLPFPVLLDLSSTTGREYAADAIPTLYVVDENGKITYGHTGFDPTIELELDRQLGIKTPNPYGVATDGESSH